MTESIDLDRFAVDYRDGVNDRQLLQKYGINSREMIAAVKKLISEGKISRQDYFNRKKKIEEVRSQTRTRVPEVPLSMPDMRSYSSDALQGLPGLRNRHLRPPGDTAMVRSLTTTGPNRWKAGSTRRGRSAHGPLSVYG